MKQDSGMSAVYSGDKEDILGADAPAYYGKEMDIVDELDRVFGERREEK